MPCHKYTSNINKRKRTIFIIASRIMFLVILWVIFVVLVIVPGLVLFIAVVYIDKMGSQN